MQFLTSIFKKYCRQQDFYKPNAISNFTLFANRTLQTNMEEELYALKIMELRSTAFWSWISLASDDDDDYDDDDGSGC